MALPKGLCPWLWNNNEYFWGLWICFIWNGMNGGTTVILYLVFSSSLSLYEIDASLYLDSFKIPSYMHEAEMLHKTKPSSWLNPSCLHLEAFQQLRWTVCVVCSTSVINSPYSTLKASRMLRRNGCWISSKYVRPSVDITIHRNMIPYPCSENNSMWRIGNCMNLWLKWRREVERRD